MLVEVGLFRLRDGCGPDLGPRGCAAFLSEPAFEKLPALFEGPGANGHAPEEVDVDTMKKLRKKGLRARR